MVVENAQTEHSPDRPGGQRDAVDDSGHVMTSDAISTMLDLRRLLLANDNPALQLYCLADQTLIQL